MRATMRMLEAQRGRAIVGVLGALATALLAASLGAACSSFSEAPTSSDAADDRDATSDPATDAPSGALDAGRDADSTVDGSCEFDVTGGGAAGWSSTTTGGGQLSAGTVAMAAALFATTPGDVATAAIVRGITFAGGAGLTIRGTFVPTLSVAPTGTGTGTGSADIVTVSCPNNQLVALRIDAEGNLLLASPESAVSLLAGGAAQPVPLSFTLDIGETTATGMVDGMPGSSPLDITPFVASAGCTVAVGASVTKDMPKISVAFTEVCVQ